MKTQTLTMAPPCPAPPVPLECTLPSRVCAPSIVDEAATRVTSHKRKSLPHHRAADHTHSSDTASRHRPASHKSSLARTFLATAGLAITVFALLFNTRVDHSTTRHISNAQVMALLDHESLMNFTRLSVAFEPLSTYFDFGTLVDV